MKRFVLSTLFTILLNFFLVSIPSAYAVIIDFNFNSLSDGSGNTQVRNYMNTILSVLHPGGTVAVAGARGEKNYTGDGHVVGPISNSVVIPRTLGNTDGNVPHALPWDTYLVNSGSDRITMYFSFPIFSVSFDYEIFPDGTCPQAGQGCSPTSGNWPDFTFEADDAVQFRTLGINPSTTGPYRHSPASGRYRYERAPQYLGLSGDYFFPSGVNKLEFIDWPRMIGIDNLRIQDEPPPPPVSTPEPSSLFLLVSGLLGFTGLKLKRIF